MKQSEIVSGSKVVINNKLIREEEEGTNYLGVILDSNLKWEFVVVVFHHEIRPMWSVSVSNWTPSKRRLRGLPGRLLPRG
jgi:hypothetical protein